jgi:2-phospho-L-lactate/phosphoenolpyruvate guanylyltransferase
MPRVSDDGDLWSLLVPVKRLDLAKTRLLRSAADRADLALAMASDTVSAAVACAAVGEVVVITDDARAASALEAIGARIVADSPEAGLNPAITLGASAARCRAVAAIPSDLPALRTAALDAVLRLAARHARAVVADAAGVGTTLLAAQRAVDLAPRFGIDSFATHIAAGAIDLSSEAGPSVRYDVDTVEALRLAIGLGVGPATNAVVAALGL